MQQENGWLWFTLFCLAITAFAPSQSLILSSAQASVAPTAAHSLHSQSD